MGTPRKPGGGFSVLSAFASVLPSASGASASSSSSTPTTAATAAASTNPNAGPNQQAASSLAPPPAGRGVTTAPGMPSPVTGLTEKDLEDAVVGMTEAEAARFRAKMAELSAVLEDELNQLEEQNNKLLNLTEKGDFGTLADRPSLKTLKKKAAGKKLEETTVFEDEDQMKPEELIRKLKETVMDLRAEAVMLRNERESSQFVRAQNLARMQLYEDTLSSTEKLLAEAHQRLHAATTELSQKNYRIAELEARLYNKSVSKKQLEDLRTKGDLRDKEMIAVRARVEVLEKENATYRQQIDLLAQENQHLRRRLKAQAVADTVSELEAADRERELRRPAVSDSTEALAKEMLAHARSDPDWVHLDEDGTAEESKPAPQAGAAPAGTELDTARKPLKPILRSVNGPAKAKRSLRFHPSILLLDGALEGDLELVKHCLRTHADVNQANEEGLTALHSAACNGHAHIVSYLIACGADVNAVDEDLWTPLHGAACFGEVGVVRQLVEHGANIFAANAENDIPLDIAVDDKTREYLSDAMARQQKLPTLYALYDYTGLEDDELSFVKGDVLQIHSTEVERAEGGWWLATDVHGRTGNVPSNYVGEYRPVIVQDL